MKILIIGGFGYGNLGDEAILSTLINKLRERGFNNIRLLSHNHIESQSQHGCEAYPSFDELASCSLFSSNRPFNFPFVLIYTLLLVILFKLKFLKKSNLLIIKILRSIQDSDWIVSCGGGFFNDGWSNFYPILLEHILCTKLNGKLIITSQSIGGFKNPFLKPFIRYVLKSAKYISVRDETSIYHIKKLGVKRNDVVLTRDESLDFMPSEKPLQYVRYKRNTTLIGLTLQGHRPYMTKEGEICKNSREEYFSNLVTAFTSINRNNSISLVIMPSTNFRKDLPSAYEFASLLEKEKLSVDIIKPINPSHLYNLIGQMELCISSNFHPVIFASVQKIPFLAISYSTKIDDFIKALKLEECLLRIDQVIPNILLEKISKLLNERSGFIEKIEKNLPKLKELVSNNFKNINDILSQS